MTTCERPDPALRGHGSERRFRSCGGTRRHERRVVQNRGCEVVTALVELQRPEEAQAGTGTSQGIPSGTAAVVDLLWWDPNPLFHVEVLEFGTLKLNVSSHDQKRPFSAIYEHSCCRTAGRGDWGVGNRTFAGVVASYGTECLHD